MNQNEFEHDEDVATMLRDASQSFVPSDEFVQSFEARLDAVMNESSAPSSRRRAMPWRIASAIAALFVFIALVGTYALWPATPTLADVQAAVNAAPWVHLVLENGSETWQAPALGIYAHKGPVSPRRFVVFVNFTTGEEAIYHEGESEIFQHDVTPAQPSGSAWDVVVGSLEQIAKGAVKVGNLNVKRTTDVVDGRTLLRFDTYFHDALDQDLLVQQLWADPRTRLPVRTHDRLHLWDRTADGPEFVEGRFEFPETGPMSIFDLGAPRDTTIAKFQLFKDQHLDPRALELLASISRADAQFLDAFTSITWQGGDVELLQWVGRPSIRRIDDRHSVGDFGACRIRVERFWPAPSAKDRPSLKSTADDVFAWCASATAAHTALYDGSIAYSQDGPLPSFMPDAATQGIKIDVRKVGWSRPGFASNYWPSRMFWPLADFNGASGVLTILENVAGTPRGTTLIRIERQEERNEYLIDPALDFICVRNTASKKRDCEWTMTREDRLEDFVQLATGHWVATTLRHIQAPDPERHFGGYEETRRIGVLPMDQKDFLPETFDGALLLEKAKAQGAVVRTY